MIASSRVTPATLTPWQRLESLCDAGTLRPLPAHNGDRPAVVAGEGRVEGRDVVCYAQDSRLSGGSVGVAEADVIVAALRRARHRGVPLVGFLESAGARIQEGAAALGGLGRVFYENVALSEQIPQISIVTGTAAGGGCYSPALTDFVVMVEGASMFLTGPKVVREALGEQISAESLGGAQVHERNGVCHFVANDDDGAIATARELLSFLPDRVGEAGQRHATLPPARSDPGVVVPADRRKVYEVREVVRRIVDEGSVLEVCAKWACSLVTAFARLDGRPVGIVASQPRHLAGVLDVEASEKGARFVRICDTYRIPLLVLVDTPGFMPGSRQEVAGVIRHGAQLVRAFAAATVRRCTVILRKAYGGAYITMNSKDLGADRVLAWPRAEVGIMSPQSAVRVIHRRELEDATEGEVAGLADAYAQRHLPVRLAVERGLVDAIVAPEDTRAALVAALGDFDPTRR